MRLKGTNWFSESKGLTREASVRSEKDDEDEVFTSAAVSYTNLFQNVVNWYLYSLKYHQ